MGGFEFDIQAADVFLPKKYENVFGVSRTWSISISATQHHGRPVLTGDGFLELMRLRPELLLPLISNREIDDKSKANDLGKVITCLQALWFIFQCISRMALSLPITLLEINTTTHCVCTIIAFGFWWHKPLNIERPTLIQKENQDQNFSLSLYEVAERSELLLD